MKQGEKEIYILIYIFSLYNIMSKRKRNSQEERNKKIENNNESIMEKYRQRRQQQQRQQSSYKTPNHPIRDLKFLPSDPNVSKKRRKDGKLKRPTAIKMRANPKPATPWRVSHPDVVEGAIILSSLKNASRKKKKGTKKKYKKKTRKKRKKRTKKKGSKKKGSKKKRKKKH